MTLKRWIPTFLAFPLGGLLALTTVGELQDPATAAAGGLVAGAVIGLGQWLALRSDGIGRRWIGYTAAAMAAGTAAAAAVTGVVAGAAVGAAQSALLGSGRLAWTAVTASTWGLAWLISSVVLAQQSDSGFFVFGSSGAIVATVLTGLVLRRLLTAGRAAVA